MPQHIAVLDRLKRSERLKAQPPKTELPERAELVRLLEKYDVPAPRYTSYPPATQFSSNFDASIYRDRLARGQIGDEISIYIHLPFCDTLCYFCGCTMIVSNNREKIVEYVEYLKREITLTREMIEQRGCAPVVVQLHWGGGSPTHLLPREIEALSDHIRSAFRFAPDAEVSIEIDPRGLTPEHIAAMRHAGFNRASIGVQDFSDDVQRAINRIQPRTMTEQVIDWCRSAGMASINLDLIYGLPYQTTASFKTTLDTVRELAPDRLAVYNFAYVPWIKPHQQLIPLETLPKATSKLALLELAIRELTDADYTYLGMDHFARSGDTLIEAQRSGTLHRNFQGYSTLAGKDLLAFGMSAIGRIENCFVQHTKELPTYYRAIQAGELPIEKGYALTREDEIREHVIMQLLCNLRVDISNMERLFGICFDEYFEGARESLRSLERDGLCKIAADRAVTVTKTGRFFLRNIAAQFDAYFGQSKSTTMFSRAV